MKKLIFLLACSTSLLLAVDGAEVYKKCSSCHGLKGEKKPLGKDEIINTMSKAKIIKELKELRDETSYFDGKKKRIMQNQAKPLSDEEITAVAQYITTLN